MEQAGPEMTDHCWLRYDLITEAELFQEYRQACKRIALIGDCSPILDSARRELRMALRGMLALEAVVTDHPEEESSLLIGRLESFPLIDRVIDRRDQARIGRDGFLLKTIEDGSTYIVLAAQSDRGLLYGVFYFLRLLQTGQCLSSLRVLESPSAPLRMINHWDNMDGSVERGYAGKSIFYTNNRLTTDLDRVRDYARLLASVGINGIVINNVNVHQEETRLIGDRLGIVAQLASIFRAYGLKIFLSVNYAAPLLLGGLPTADPLDEGVWQWWHAIVARLYEQIPDFGGFLVKADSEGRPGPFTYGRNHSEGANLLAELLRPYGGLVIWRCFVYNCHQDWRDFTTDRAKAAYEQFKPLDGQFTDNVILQIKNGPMDFQVREPVSPLLGAMTKTNQLLELQITQEYTGQQKHLCFLAPQWKTVLDFDTFSQGQGSYVRRIADGTLYQRKYAGLAGVANIGDTPFWTGHIFAQANFYGYGRLAWNPELTASAIATEWVKSTFGTDSEVVATISRMLLASWEIYESYTAPLGSGWMVNPGCHYGPNVDGYEYSRWGTYHRANHTGLGVDRTMRSGTGFTGQYFPENTRLYEELEFCPDELLLFFHHLPYTYLLKNGKTIIQHIYDTHFDGVEQVKGLIKSWDSLREKIDDRRFQQVRARLRIQLDSAREWRDVINTYFYRKTGIPDALNRKIYP